MVNLIVTSAVPTRLKKNNASPSWPCFAGRLGIAVAQNVPVCWCNPRPSEEARMWEFLSLILLTKEMVCVNMHLKQRGFAITGPLNRQVLTSFELHV